MPRAAVRRRVGVLRLVGRARSWCSAGSAGRCRHRHAARTGRPSRTACRSDCDEYRRSADGSRRAADTVVCRSPGRPAAVVRAGLHDRVRHVHVRAAHGGAERPGDLHRRLRAQRRADQHVHLRTVYDAEPRSVVSKGSTCRQFRGSGLSMFRTRRARVDGRASGRGADLEVQPCLVRAFSVRSTPCQ